MNLRLNISIFESLKYLYKNSCSLGILFQDGYRKGRMLENVVHFFYHQAKEDVGAGFYQMLPNPDSKGAMKRMWMFMRWMVRDGAVDLGLWNFYPKSELLIPLDVHVARISRQYELLNRKSNDFKAVVELTNNLKVFDSQDPVKYDFALFGLGVNSEK